MRVVAGTARGVALTAPRGGRVRPTSDRVRESMFSILGSMGMPAGTTVVDLFAGTGALGIEAISRGATRATFVERDTEALEALEGNLERTSLAERATVVRADVLRWLRGAEVAELPYDLALVDPPYAFDQWDEVLAAEPGRVVIIESDRAVALPPGYELHRERRYGSTVVTVAVLQERHS